MSMFNVIFDVGANDGVDGLGYALFNQNLKVYAFEANPDLVNKINENKKIIEKFTKIQLDNYTIINKAVSNFNGTSNFYLSEYDLCSSLLKYKFVKIKKEISCEVISLKSFCDDIKVNNIIYLHSDTQGSDLNVLKGLKEYKNKVHAGVIETMIKKEDINYEGASSFDEFENFFNENNFIITKKKFNDYQNKEVNVYFKNKSISKKDFISKNDFNRRFIQRIINKKSNLKDKIFMYYLKVFRFKN